MRICHIGNINSVHFQYMVNHLQKYGHENFILSPAPPISEKRIEVLSKAIKVDYCGPLIKGSFFSPSFWWSRYSVAQWIKERLKKIKPDLLHGYYLTDCGLIGAYANLHPYVVSAIGSDVLIGLSQGIIKRQAVKFVIRSADFIFCYSKQILDNVLRYSKKSGQAKYIHNGVNLEIFKKKKPDESIMNSLNFPANSKIVISMRNFTPKYNLECLIDAIPYVIAKIPDARFILMGEGPSKNGLINRSNELNILDYVRFLKYVPNNKVPNYLNIADIYVSASLTDGMSVSLLEAMACEKPVVVSDIPANNMIVKNFENGLLFPKGDSKALANQIIYLLNNRELGRQMGEKNLKIVSENYNFQKFINQIVSACNELVNGKYRK